MICHMNLNVPFTMEDHLTLNALIRLLLGGKKQQSNEIDHDENVEKKIVRDIKLKFVLEYYAQFKLLVHVTQCINNDVINVYNKWH